MGGRILLRAALLFGAVLASQSAPGQTLGDLAGNWVSREPADSGGTFVTLYTIATAPGTMTVRSVGIRLENGPNGASAGGGSDWLFELSATGRDLTGTLLFRQTLRGLCNMPDLRLPVRGTISADGKMLVLQYDFPRQQYDPCGWDRSMTTPTAVEFTRGQ